MLRTQMLANFALILQLALGFLFAWSALAKAYRPHAFATGLSDYELLPEWTIFPVAMLIIVIEAGIAASHIAGQLLALGILLAILFLLSALAVVGYVLRRGLTVRCLCFGSTTAEPVTGATVVRLCAMLAAEALLRVSSASPDALRRLSDLKFTDQILAAASSILLILVISWTGRISDVGALRRCRDCRPS